MDTLSPSAPPTTARPRRFRAFWRRLAFFGLTLTTAVTGAVLMLHILEANGLSPLELCSLVMFTALFTWISGAFWTAVAGFIVRLIGRDPAVLDPAALAQRPLQHRTAVVVPIYNEDTARVFAGLEAIWDSLQRESGQEHFDLFVLSDTRRPDIAAAEQIAWKSLVARRGASGRIYYRRRAENTGRKSGNIAEFVRNWGGAYEYMVVLDADSIMSGRALVSLAQLMDAHPDVGIVQALPLLVGRETLFARLLQFAVRLNGPMFASGLAFWQLGESNYWGHNAIIRVRPFAEHCALPRLPGRAPFGGEILSHDIVEAAFMRRAGYKVWLVPDIAGSWEEVPSNVIDFAARDRRWAQGNLQHVGVMPMRGLHWLSRIHMLTGVLSYVTSPMWLLVLLVSSALTCLEALGGHQYFQPGAYSLFPSWPEYRQHEIAALLTMTIAVLMLPKLFGLLLALRERAQRARFGGALRLLGGFVFEQALSMLLAPTMMLFHTSFVVHALLGRSVNWDAQPREDRGVTWREGLLRHRWHLLLGLAWGALILTVAPDFIWWMLPVIGGMLLAVPFTVLTSRASLGRALRARGWLLTPEEVSPPPEIDAMAAALAAAQATAAHAPERLADAAAIPARAPLAMTASPARFLWSWGPRNSAVRAETASGQPAPSL